MKSLTSKNKPKEDSEFFETSFGDRKVSHINQSRMIALPKMALQNACGTSDGLSMTISLVQKGDEKFLKLTPICKTIDDEDIEEKDDIEDNEFKTIIDTIQKDFPAENIIDEKELQGGLRIFLKTKFPDSDIQREVHTDDSVLDLLVDQKYAFEVKVPRNRTELRNLRGQIEEYKEHFPNLCVVIYENEDYNMLEDIKKYVDIYKEKYNVPSVVLQGKKRK